MKTLYRSAATLGCLGAAMGLAQAQVGIGVGTPHASAQLELNSTTRGLLAPRMTAAQRTAISSPAQGLLVYQTDGAAPGLWHHNGSSWLPLSQATDLALPFNKSASNTLALFVVQQTNSTSSGAALYGGSSGLFGTVGQTGAAGIGVGGIAFNTAYPGLQPAGVAGVAESTPGVYARSLSASSLLTEKSSTDTGSAATVRNTNASNSSDVLSISNAGAGNGINIAGTSGTGVYSATSGMGLWGITTSQGSAGVIADNTGAGEAVVGRTNSSFAGAVVGRNDGTGYGVRGFVTTSGIGVRGESASGYGVQAISTSGTALYAEKTGAQTGSAAQFANTNSSNSSSTLTVSNNGTGAAISANASVGNGVYSSAMGMALWGITTSQGSAGVIADNSGAGEAVVGRTNSGVAGAVVGRNDGTGYGVRGFVTTSGTGVRGESASGYGVQAISNNGTAGDFSTNSSITVPTMRLRETENEFARLTFQNTNAPFWTVAAYPSATGAQASAAFNVYYSDKNGGSNLLSINGNGNATFLGNIAKGGGSFKIDHPLDPENKYLYHSFVESPDMMNVYNGNATLDGQGEAVVQLPAYFESLNQDFRYQLTPIGAPGPNLYVADEIRGNQFRIAGGKPGARVSWQVTGVRHDKYAEQNRIQPEVAKDAEDRGYYLHPAAFGQPASRGVRIVRGSASPDATRPAAVASPAPDRTPAAATASSQAMPRPAAVTAPAPRPAATTPVPATSSSQPVPAAPAPAPRLTEPGRELRPTLPAAQPVKP